MIPRFIPLFLVVAAFLGACTDPAPRGGGDILVMGDSVMAWNGTSDAAIPDGIAEALGRRVVSKAIPGAQFDNDSGIAGAVGFDIRRQFPGGRWNWIVLNGGANDLGSDCGCGACGSVVDGLIGPDAQTGSIPAFVDRLQWETGARILWMGYYKGNGKGSFQGCRNDLVEMEARIARFAQTRPDVFFVDSEDVIDPTEPGMFAADDTHPSPRASKMIGSYLARQIAQAGRSQKP
ncbi:GDSL family lipase [Sulfitobacter alexandrii]|uniref:GDSL family lipase n=1 Tax=Sulfitobacter alexandrii TaxID=1917485 RepID=A0A1J0WLM1_9RHOB|nr:SGNH/GDSL hydrolase family protein [Sulfitobacter alexandrii]APE45215.1 GDSL family lipase [Sulfitobacter alexandrii]